ncbi:MAG: (2Fe-2S)-binding protein [Rhodocyclaceae bacterium]|jgi:predicted molibdopterin-dependent oxidoreductase YjgC|nr:(2Fe-2S)-binding protein [Rhodocyclaceae bacterium]MCL4758628.1 (2Fe-2S)-binding protein [Rhodocyclaceae bacterium]
MPELIVNDRPQQVAAGISVAAALARLGHGTVRISVGGAPRAPLCGMGVCQECRVRIDGRLQLACQTVVRDGMRISLETLLGQGGQG